MKIEKNQIPELSKNVSQALFEHVKKTDSQLSSHDIKNAWIKFSNTLEAEENKKVLVARNNNSRTFSYKIFSSRVLPVLGFGFAVLFLTLSNFNKEVNQTEIALQKTSQVELSQVDQKLASSVIEVKDYKLVKPEKFSEMVGYVAKSNDSYINKIARNKKFDSELDRRITAELEQSLRSTFYDEAQESIEMDLNNRSFVADENSNSNLVFVSNY